MKTKSNAIAAAPETHASASSFSDAPRFVVTDRRGGEYLIAANRRALYFRPARGVRGERVDSTKVIADAVSERDLWPTGVSPLNDPGAAWAVRELLRQWRLWPES